MTNTAVYQFGFRRNPGRHAVTQTSHPYSQNDSGPDALLDPNIGGGDLLRYARQFVTEGWDVTSIEAECTIQGDRLVEQHLQANWGEVVCQPLVNAINDRADPNVIGMMQMAVLPRSALITSIFVRKQDHSATINRGGTITTDVITDVLPIMDAAKAVALARLDEQPADKKPSLLQRILRKGTP